MEVASEDHHFKMFGGRRSQRVEAIASGRGITKRCTPSSSLPMPQEECQQFLVINQYLFIYLTQNTQNTKKLFDQQLLIHPQGAF